MKTLVYWLGLILIGFSIWVSFIALLIYLATNSQYLVPLGSLTAPAMLLAGAIIFTVIGLRMIKEGQ